MRSPPTSPRGLTCRTALVLAHDDVYRQWAYTALSRGTDRNQLYVIAERADPRAEYAPSRPRDVADRLQADLRRSGAQVLAADEAQALVDKARALERRQRAAERRRVADRDFGRDL